MSEKGGSDLPIRQVSGSSDTAVPSTDPHDVSQGTDDVGDLGRC